MRVRDEDAREVCKVKSQMKIMKIKRRPQKRGEMIKKGDSELSAVVSSLLFRK